MSFMFNPYPYDDLMPVNRPELSEETKEAIVSGAIQSIKVIFEGKRWKHEIK